MRAPFQILAIPFRKDKSFQYAVMHRSDCDQWQFVAGGGEADLGFKQDGISARL